MAGSSGDADDRAGAAGGVPDVPAAAADYIAAISASPNSEHFTSVAPSIRRAKS